MIVSTHPRTQKRGCRGEVPSVGETAQAAGLPRLQRLQMSSKVVLSDSGTINEESSILNFQH